MLGFPDDNINGDAPALVVTQPKSLTGDFETYEGFRSLVLSYIDTDGADISPNLVDSLILMGEKRINREVRCREMESPLAITVQNGVAPVPADYLELKNARANIQGAMFKIERVDLETFERNHPWQVGAVSYAGPLTMARDGDTFVFGPRLFDGQVITGSYYVRFTPLKDRPDSLLDPLSPSYQRLYAEHSDLYLYSCLEDAESLIGRPTRSQNWRGRYAELKAMLMMQSQQERFSGGPMRIRSDSRRIGFSYPYSSAMPSIAPAPAVTPAPAPAPASTYYPADYGPADYVL